MTNNLEPSIDTGSDGSELQQIINNKSITSLFQPIISTKNKQVFGHEALSRGPANSVFHSPIKLFNLARRFGSLVALENICREKAIQRFYELSLPGKLFLNVTPDSLLQFDFKAGETMRLLDELGVDPEQVVIELTEQSPTDDYALMKKAVEHYRSMGFAIAIDDLGAGYSSLRLWSELHPEYVKIDKHFISGIQQNKINKEFIYSIISIARAVNSKVIVEGVETQEEYETLLDMDVDLMQGFYFAPPKWEPSFQWPVQKTVDEPKPKIKSVYESSSDTVADIVVESEAVQSTTPVLGVEQLFKKFDELLSVAVLDRLKPIGVVHRHQFMEMLSQPYSRDLNRKKTVVEVMDRNALCVEHHLPLDQVSRLITSRVGLKPFESFIVVKDSRYLGLGKVMDLLQKITEKQVRSARHANPLTMLPGNIPIQNCISQLISTSSDFVACYIDLDNFKAYNDVYGYSRGDDVLLIVAELLQKVIIQESDFVGHIGGDDFIVIFSNGHWKSCVRELFSLFDQKVISLYSQEHIEAGGIFAKDRFGTERLFPLLSLSVGALRVAGDECEDISDLSDRISLVKQQAKGIAGNSLVFKSLNESVAVSPVKSLSE